MSRPISILHGHPVPYCLTVQIDGQSVADATPYLDRVDDYLRPSGARRTGCVEGAYVWYAYPDGGGDPSCARCHRRHYA